MNSNQSKLAWIILLVVLAVGAFFSIKNFNIIFSRLGLLENKQTALEARVDGIDSRVSKVERLCASLENDLRMIKSQIRALNASIAEHREQLAVLNSQGIPAKEVPSTSGNIENENRLAIQKIIADQVAMRKKLEDLATQKTIALQNAETLKRNLQSPDSTQSTNLKSVLSVGYLGGGGGLVFDQELPVKFEDIKTSFRAAGAAGKEYQVYNFGLDAKKDINSEYFYGASADYAYYTENVKNIPVIDKQKRGDSLSMGVFVGKKLAEAMIVKLGYNWALGITGQMGYQF
jgi:hypothetical protein